MPTRELLRRFKVQQNRDKLRDFDRLWVLEYFETKEAAFNRVRSRKHEYRFLEVVDQLSNKIILKVVSEP